MFKALALIYCIWGFNWVVMRTAMDFFPPVTFVAYRFTFGAIVLLAIALHHRLPLPDKKLLPWIALVGALQIAVSNIIIQLCIVELGAGLSAVLNYTMPLWVAILAKFFLGEDLTKRKIVGIVVAIVGLFILMNADLSVHFGYILFALVAAISFAIANIIFKLKLTKCNMVVFNTWQMITAAVILCVTAIVTDQEVGNFTAISIGCILYNGFLASALAFFLWSYVLKQMQASKASTALLAVPVVGVLSGVIFLGEPLTIASVLGMLLILGGIATVVHN